jgi:uncharacterized protein YceK
MLKVFFILFLSYHLVACGSLKTVTASNYKIAYDLKRHKTHCSVSTRIYSGVVYDFCRINAKPQGTYVNGVESMFFIIDIFLLSPVMDTILLPITIPQQIIYGNPKIK